MATHRVRLDDTELAAICAALRARVAGSGPQTQVFIKRLVTRLEECSPGNPEWRLAGVEGYEGLK